MIIKRPSLSKIQELKKLEVKITQNPFSVMGYDQGTKLSKIQGLTKLKVKITQTHFRLWVMIKGPNFLKFKDLQN